MSAPTPTPWEHLAHSTNGLDLEIPTGGTIYGDGWHLALVFADGGLGKATAAANAELIVRAVNCHADLVQALKNTRALLKAFVRPETDAIARVTLEEADAAIAKAESQAERASPRER